jgi:hypothetical protein
MRLVVLLGALLACALDDFGAVGAPDRGTFVVKAEAHCDGGDRAKTMICALTRDNPIKTC